MVKSKVIWDNKWHLGNPKEMVVVHKCFCCGQETTNVFPIIHEQTTDE